LLAAHKYGYSPKSTGENDYDYYDEGEGGDATLGDVIYEREIDTRSLPKMGSSRLFNFMVADKIPDLKGIYHISIRSANDSSLRYSRFISLSDIGLIAKEGKEKMFVFANSIKSATSLNGVNITVYGANNQVLGMGATNNEGVAEIAYIRKEFSGFKPAMVIAKTGDDFNYLPFQSTRVNTSRFEVGGKAYNKTGMDAFIYAERDIVGRVRALAPVLQDGLRRLADHPLVGEARSVGLIGALELARDKATRRFFDKRGEVGTICRDFCFQNGLIMRAVRDTLIISPPLVISREQVDELAEKAWRCLDLTLERCRADGRI